MQPLWRFFLFVFSQYSNVHKLTCRVLHMPQCAYIRECLLRACGNPSCDMDVEP